MLKERQLPLYFLTISLFLILISSDLFSEGMFADGVWYAAISKNLANGIGSFWDLHFTSTLFPHFHEHPPLAFGFQALLFKIFGDSIFIERVYSFLTFVFTGIIIVKIWNAITEEKNKYLGWLPLLILAAIPTLSWSVPNNMLENTMVIFSTWAIFNMVKSLNKNRWLNLTISGFFLFLAFLTKGFVGIFPLSFFFAVYILKRDISFSRFLIDTTVLILVMLLLFLGLYLVAPNGIVSIVKYIEIQVIGSINNEVTVDSRFYILKSLFLDFLPVIGVFGILYFILRKRVSLNFKNKWFLVFLFVGLSGVVPMMISLKQRSFYNLPSFPLFSIAIALVVGPLIHYLVLKINLKKNVFLLISSLVLLLSIGLVLSKVGEIRRDVSYVKDMHAIKKILPDDNIKVSIQPELREDIDFQGFFSRYTNAAVDSIVPFANKYVLVKKDWESEMLSNYNKNSTDFNLYDLYELKTE